MRLERERGLRANDRRAYAPILLTAVFKAYAIRTRMARRMMQREGRRRREAILDLNEAETARRLAITAEERAHASNLLQAHVSVRDVVRSYREQRRKEEAVSKVVASRLRELVAEEERERIKVLDDATFYWAQLGRTYRKFCATGKFPSTAAAGGASSLPSAAGDDDDGTQTRPSSEFSSRTPRPPTSLMGAGGGPLMMHEHTDSDLGGFPLDELAKFLVDYEKQLKYMRASIVRQQRILQQEHSDTVALRDRMSFEAQGPLASGTAWVGALPPPTADAAPPQAARPGTTQTANPRARRVSMMDASGAAKPTFPQRPATQQSNRGARQFT